MTDFNIRKTEILRELIKNGHISLDKEKLDLENVVFEDSILLRDTFVDDANLIRIRFFLENPDIKPLFISRNQLKQIPSKFILLKELDGQEMQHGNLMIALLYFFDFVGLGLDDKIFLGRFKVRKKRVIENSTAPNFETVTTVQIEDSEVDDILIDSFGQKHNQIRLF